MGPNVATIGEEFGLAEGDFSSGDHERKELLHRVVVKKCQNVIAMMSGGCYNEKKSMPGGGRKNDVIVFEMELRLLGGRRKGEAVLERGAWSMESADNGGGAWGIDLMDYAVLIR